MGKSLIPKNPEPFSSILGLDVGQKRIGVAISNVIAKMPRPLCTLTNNEQIFSEVGKIAKTERAGFVVVGLPRNLDGLETSQSEEIREFATNLTLATGLRVEFADETLSSKRAEQLMRTHQTKHGLDEFAACFILEEFFAN